MSVDDILVPMYNFFVYLSGERLLMVSVDTYIEYICFIGWAVDYEVCFVGIIVL